MGAAHEARLGQPENPLDRAVRDAERVRRWFAADDADFVVKVYAAVTGPAPAIERTTACAVVSHDQLCELDRPAWRHSAA